MPDTVGSWQRCVFAQNIGDASNHVFGVAADLKLVET